MRTLFATLGIVALLGAGCTIASQPSSQATPSSMTQPQTDAPTSERQVLTNDVEGLYVTPDHHNGKLPGIVIVHEWWGLNDQIQQEAHHIAAQGYAVFAVDLYDGEVTSDPTRAGQLAGEVRAHPDVADAKIKAALDYLAAQTEVNGLSLAAWGWCFGGGFSARAGASGDPRIKATVVYYGTPVTDPTALKKMKAPVLGVWGEDDQSIPAAQGRAFEAALKSQGTTAEFHYYPGAGHAFANPTRGDSYRPEATADAWAKTMEFLKTNLGS